MITGYQIQTWLRMALVPQPQTQGLAALVERRDSQLIEQQSEKILTLGNVGPLVVHNGRVRAAQPIEHTYNLKNEKFSVGVQLPGVWLRNDNGLDVRGRIAQLGQRYLLWPAQLLAALLVIAATELCITGKAFFATDHTLGKSGTFSNSLSYNVGTPTAPTPDEVALAIWYVVSKMFSLPDDTGEPMNEDARSFAILVHPDLMPAFAAALSADFLSTGSGVRDNVLKTAGYAFELHASPKLTHLTDKFIVVRKDYPAGMPPFLMQENRNEARQTILDESSDLYKTDDIVQAAIYAVGNVGFGFPQMAALCTFT